VWGSVSRAVRTPNFEEAGLRINHTVFDIDGPGPASPRVISILPNDDLHSETVLANELGYRMQASQSLYLDIAAFYNVYDELIVDESAGALFETNPPPAHLAIISRHANKMQGDTYGIEFGPSWQVTDQWKLAAGYTWLQMNLRSAAVGRAGEEQEGDSPRHQLHLHSFMQWAHNLSFDTAIYYVDNLPNKGIASYVRLDARLAWSPIRSLELSLAAANLLDNRHGEFHSFEDNPAQAQRSFQGKLTWRF
jgi:iron complex outermembrane receptor protein